MPPASRRIGLIFVAVSLVAPLAVWLVPSNAEPPAARDPAPTKTSVATPPPKATLPETPSPETPRLPDAPPILQAPPSAAPINSPQLLEILELRRQRGSILDGSILDQPNAETPANDLATFQESLKNAAAQQPTDSPPDAPSQPALGSASDSGIAPYRSGAVGPQSATEDERLAALLLRAGRALDRRANRYERESDTVEAKRLRALADSLRAAVEALPAR